eukprot:2244976-Prymnesium_polylepis.1
MASSDGLNFVGDPQLVVPRVMERTMVQGAAARLHLNVDMSTFGDSKPQISIPARTRPPTPILSKRQHVAMSHNLAVTYHNGSFIVVGGNVQHWRAPVVDRAALEAGLSAPTGRPVPVPSSSAPQVAGARSTGQQAQERSSHRGIWIARSPTVWFARGDRHASLGASPPAAAATAGSSVSWSELRFIIGGKHEGCIERRDASRMTWLVPSVCEYDGRLALVIFKGRYFLFARANPAASGQRFVQLTTSTDSFVWSTFRMIHIAGYNHTEGNVYFWGAQVCVPCNAGSCFAVCCPQPVAGEALRNAATTCAR